MADVQFADILFILIVCVVLFIILSLVNRGKKKSVNAGSDTNTESNPINSPKAAEDD